MKLNFGLNLKILREKRGWNQEKLASEIGVKTAAISKYENGAVEPKLDYLIKFCEIFDVSLDELMLEPSKNSSALSPKHYKKQLHEMELLNKKLSMENTTLKEEKGKLQERLISVLERALNQK